MSDATSEKSEMVSYEARNEEHPWQFVTYTYSLSAVLNNPFQLTYFNNVVDNEIH